MNSKRILAHDRRQAAVHEAGHVAVARRLGLRISSAWIVLNEGEAAADELTWSGPRPDRKRVRSGSTVSPHGRRCRGGCGISVARRLDRRLLPRRQYVMSESDWHLAGCSPDELDDAINGCDRRGWPTIRTRWLLVARADRGIAAIDRRQPAADLARVGRVTAAPRRAGADRPAHIRGQEPDAWAGSPDSANSNPRRVDSAKGMLIFAVRFEAAGLNHQLTISAHPPHDLQAVMDRAGRDLPVGSLVSRR
jgi:hypothetical protein